MSSKPPGEPEDKSYNTLPFLPHRHVHIPSAPGPPGITTVNLPPAPPDLPIAPLGPISLVVLRPSEKDNVVPSGMTDMRLQSQSCKERQAIRHQPIAPPPLPIQVDALERNIRTMIVKPRNHTSKSAQSRRRRKEHAHLPQRLRQLLSSLFWHGSASITGNLFFSRLTHSYRPNFLRRASEKRLDEVLAYLQGRCRSVSAIQYKR